ncbi:thioesterase superfamily protein [Stemphylium lycopersici]|uniref:Thioesterase superfamily protein n=1 Tax=Stemphylium lycopersici TaxID=183478 RepID=A0A364N3U7_STELY|nr:thioesterase superfamily protein [Stemphylium lycopersici]RAR10830.1 thioesterase superfamily protein [Stemphylium lycopersici]
MSSVDEAATFNTLNDDSKMDVLTPALTSKPWIAALLADPTWTHMPTKSRSPKPTGEDSFVAETLMTERTVRAVITFRPSKQEEEEEDVHSNGGMASYKEIKSVVDLGTGLNGYPQIVHGGVAATLLDETCGILVIANADRKVEREREAGRESVAPSYFTAYLNTTYKRPVPTPGPLLCTAKIQPRDGADDRKVFVRATIEDGEGLVYTVGEALFVKATAKL